MLKTFVLPLALSLLSTAALASQTTVRTHVTCEQDDGDVWYSTALVPSLAKSGYNILVVLNNEDTGSKTLLEDSSAAMKTVGSQTVVYNKSGDIKLVISSAVNGAPGRLTKIADGPGNKIDEAVICYTDSEITYDSNNGPEPRITVGN